MKPSHWSATLNAIDWHSSEGPPALDDPRSAGLGERIAGIPRGVVLVVGVALALVVALGLGMLLGMGLGKLLTLLPR